MGMVDDKSPNHLAHSALFFAGVCSYLQMELSLLPQSFAVNRLGISEYSAGRYLSYTLDAQHLMSTAGIFIASGLTFLDEYCEKFTKCFSIPVVWLFCFNYGAIWKFCSFGDFNVNMFKYCWALIFAGAGYGFCETLALHIGGDHTSTFEMGGAVLTGFVAITVPVVEVCFERKGVDVDYWMMTSQCCVAFMWSLITAILWTAYVACLLESTSGAAKETEGTGGCHVSDDGSSVTHAGTANLSAAFREAASPFFMTQFGLGPMFLFYPLLAPMEIAPSDSCYRIQLYSKLCECAAGVGVGIISRFDQIAVKWEGKCGLWNLIWLFLIPQVVCMIIINRVMHYPTSWIGRLINMKKRPATLLTTIFIASTCILLYTGFGGIYDNAKGNQNGDGERHAQIVNVLNNSTVFSVSTILMYFGEGYCSLYKDYKLAMEFGYKWPTSGVNGFRAFFFWVRVGFLQAWENLSTLVSTKPSFQMF